MYRVDGNFIDKLWWNIASILSSCKFTCRNFKGGQELTLMYADRWILNYTWPGRVQCWRGARV